MKTDQCRQKELAALEVLRSTGVDVMEAAIVAKAALTVGRGKVKRAMKRGWCAENPVRRVEPERVVEKRIAILSSEEIKRLLDTASAYQKGACLPAVGMMLYAGIRPHEVVRLRWEDVKAEAGIICISPQHSKTGGARHVTIQPPLARLLRRTKKAPHERICPPNWSRSWAALHRVAGFPRWQPDVLRHTFATHHLAAFRSYDELQLEMGHRSTTLLRTRYIAMETQCGMLMA